MIKPGDEPIINAMAAAIYGCAKSKVSRLVSSRSPAPTPPRAIALAYFHAGRIMEANGGASIGDIFAKARAADAKKAGTRKKLVDPTGDEVAVFASGIVAQSAEIPGGWFSGHALFPLTLPNLKIPALATLLS